MTISGNGNTTINGGIIALSAAFDHILIKSGTGTLTLTGTTSTLDGAVNVNGGTVAISDWRAITNNTSTVSVGSTTTAAILSIVGNNLTLANLTTSKVINLAGTTGAATILANQTGTSPGVIFNADFTATGAGAKTLFLGGANVGANTINGAIVNNTGTFTTALTKIDAGRWILAGTNSYTGATTIANGTLQLKANAAASTILADTSAITFNQVNQYAGGTLELIGQASTNNVETLGALTPTARALSDSLRVAEVPPRLFLLPLARWGEALRSISWLLPAVIPFLSLRRVSQTTLPMRDFITMVRTLHMFLGRV